MLYFRDFEYESSDSFICSYAGVTPGQLENAVTEALESMGYKHLGSGVFEKGSRVMRLLFGAFCKYFKFRISIDSSDSRLIKLQISKATTGLSGGVIGINQVKNEMEHMKKVFQTI
ncbi:hypothetical protein GGR21_003441 [Dysgonomonas hofstadii]|uniref:Uncharacterized protein n=1 Tax=Dysgonomonas hofstadii TaxID=637886 RepID=A0A840CV23_9BACT|nr:hypothetical protein [Dysgonomonas hofstadii]MBB4037524.1 hypothetical protein [Dysgonomonas hofstadii]